MVQPPHSWLCPLWPSHSMKQSQALVAHSLAFPPSRRQRYRTQAWSRKGTGGEHTSSG